MTDALRAAADQARDMAKALPGQRRVELAEETEAQAQPFTRTGHLDAAVAKANSDAAYTVAGRRALLADAPEEEWVRGAHAERIGVAGLDVVNRLAERATTKTEVDTIRQLTNIYQHALTEDEANAMVDKLAEHAGEPGLEFLNPQRLREMVHAVYRAGGPPAIQAIARGR